MAVVEQISANANKHTNFEQATRVPLFLSVPGQKNPGHATAALSEYVDIFPTLTELCGLPPRSGLEGHSLVPQLKNANAPRPWPAITTHNRGNHSVRSEDWRYIRYADGSEELYDHRSDPHEWTNLVHEATSEAVVRDHAHWLPQPDVPAVPGSAQRILEQVNGRWIWEGKPIHPAELEH